MRESSSSQTADGHLQPTASRLQDQDRGGNETGKAIGMMEMALEVGMAMIMGFEMCMGTTMAEMGMRMWWVSGDGNGNGDGDGTGVCKGKGNGKEDRMAVAMGIAMGISCQWM